MEVNQSIDSDDVNAHKILMEIISKIATINIAMSTLFSDDSTIKLPTTVSDRIFSEYIGITVKCETIMSDYDAILTKCETIMSDYSESSHYDRAKQVYETIIIEYHKFKESYDGILYYISISS